MQAEVFLSPKNNVFGLCHPMSLEDRRAALSIVLNTMSFLYQYVFKIKDLSDTEADKAITLCETTFTQFKSFMELFKNKNIPCSKLIESFGPFFSDFDRTQTYSLHDACEVVIKNLPFSSSSYFANDQQFNVLNEKMNKLMAIKDFVHCDKKEFSEQQAIEIGFSSISAIIRKILFHTDIIYPDKKTKYNTTPFNYMQEMVKMIFQCMIQKDLPFSGFTSFLIDSIQTAKGAEYQIDSIPSTFDPDSREFKVNPYLVSTSRSRVILSNGFALFDNKMMKYNDGEIKQFIVDGKNIEFDMRAISPDNQNFAYFEGTNLVYKAGEDKPTTLSSDNSNIKVVKLSDKHVTWLSGDKLHISHGNNLIEIDNTKTYEINNKLLVYHKNDHSTNIRVSDTKTNTLTTEIKTDITLTEEEKKDLYKCSFAFSALYLIVSTGQRLHLGEVTKKLTWSKIYSIQEKVADAILAVKFVTTFSFVALVDVKDNNGRKLQLNEYDTNSGTTISFTQTIHEVEIKDTDKFEIGEVSLNVYFIQQTPNYTFYTRPTDLVKISFPYFNSLVTRTVEGILRFVELYAQKDDRKYTYEYSTYFLPVLRKEETKYCTREDHITFYSAVIQKLREEKNKKQRIRDETFLEYSVNKDRVLIKELPPRLSRLRFANLACLVRIDVKGKNVELGLKISQNGEMKFAKSYELKNKDGNWGRYYLIDTCGNLRNDALDFAPHARSKLKMESSNYVSINENYITSYFRVTEYMLDLSDVEVIENPVAYWSLRPTRWQYMSQYVLSFVKRQNDNNKYELWMV